MELGAGSWAVRHPRQSPVALQQSCCNKAGFICAAWRIRELLLDIRAMSVSRRNTFDIFNESREEASVYTTHDANSVLKKKRKKKKKPGDIPHTSDHIAAADVTSQVGPDEPEVRHTHGSVLLQSAVTPERPLQFCLEAIFASSIACDAFLLSDNSLLQAGSNTDALSSQTAALSSNSSDQLLPTLDSKLYIGGSGPTPADSSLATASTNGHLSEGEQGGDYRATCMHAHWPSVCPLTSQAPAVTALKVYRSMGCQFRDKEKVCACRGRPGNQLGQSRRRQCCCEQERPGKRAQQPVKSKKACARAS